MTLMMIRIFNPITEIEINSYTVDAVRMNYGHT